MCVSRCGCGWRVGSGGGVGGVGGVVVEWWWRKPNRMWMCIFLPQRCVSTRGVDTV